MDELSATDRCVKCGLCLPHCPSFALSGNEADSPRGRISLMQWLAQSPELTPGLIEHLEGCLGCGACEAMCPSRVPFTALMDQARARLRAQHPPGPATRAFERTLNRVTASPRLLRTAATAARLWRGLGLATAGAHLPGRTGRLNALLREAETGPAPKAAHTSPPGPGEPLRLFPGCTGRALDAATLDHATRLLEALGYRLEAADTAACCGALAQHAGDLGQAEQLARHNRRVLAGDTPVLSLASACAARLQQTLSGRVYEIMSFLAAHARGRLAFAPPDGPVGLYLPCTQRNALRQADALRQTLADAGAEWVELNPRGGCCGAAGRFMLEHPETARRLGDTVVETVRETGVRTVLCNNIGCTLHLRARLRAAGLRVTVMHPLRGLRART